MVQLSSVYLSVVACNECIVAKLCEIRPKLLLITNRVAYWLSNDMKINDLG